MIEEKPCDPPIQMNRDACYKNLMNPVDEYVWTPFSAHAALMNLVATTRPRTISKAVTTPAAVFDTG